MSTRAETAVRGGEVDVFGFLAKFAPLVFLLVLMAVFAVVEPRFLKPLNLFNVMRQVSIYGLLAIGMTFVILTRGIDLSVGSAARRRFAGSPIAGQRRPNRRLRPDLLLAGPEAQLVPCQSSASR